MNEELHGGQLVLLMMVVGGMLAVGILINVFVCWLLSRAFESIPREHRRMEPGMVWLLLIPCFSLVWNFFVFPKLAQSFRAAFEARGQMANGDCGERLAWWTAGCCAAGIIPCLGYAASLAYLVLLILFLVKANDLRDQMIPQAEPRY